MSTVTTEVQQDIPYFPSTDTEARRHAVRAYVTGNLTGAKMQAQRLGDEPFDRSLWRAVMDDIGVGSVLLPTSAGGMGLGHEDFAVCVEELGRGLLAAPTLSSLALALGALRPVIADDAGDHRDATELAVRISEGRTVAAVALLDSYGRVDADLPTVSADSTVTGTRAMVVNAADAESILTFAERDGTLGLYAVDTAAATLTPHPSLDPSRSLATVAFHDAPATLLADGEAALAARDSAIRFGRLAAAAESIGGAESALAETVTYALARHQFGKPIAAFQAVKHLCADSLLAIQRARAVLSYAVWALDDDSPEAGRALIAAKVAATDAYVLAAGNGVQIHGAMGTTREMSVQVHFRRARFLSLYFGSNDDDRDELARQLGLGA